MSNTEEKVKKAKINIFNDIYPTTIYYSIALSLIYYFINPKIGFLITCLSAFLIAKDMNMFKFSNLAVFYSLSLLAVSQFSFTMTSQWFVSYIIPFLILCIFISFSKTKLKSIESFCQKVFTYINGKLSKLHWSVKAVIGGVLLSIIASNIIGIYGGTFLFLFIVWVLKPDVKLLQNKVSFIIILTIYNFVVHFLFLKGIFIIFEDITLFVLTYYDTLLFPYVALISYFVANTKKKTKESEQTTETVENSVSQEVESTDNEKESFEESSNVNESSDNKSE